MKNKRSWIHGLLGAAISIACLFYVVDAAPEWMPFGARVNFPEEQIRFSRVIWNCPIMDCHGTYNGTRYNMVEDLLRRHNFSGWNRSQVEGLLGRYHVTEINGQKQIISYVLREHDGWDLLTFELDDQQKVVAEYVRHVEQLPAF